MNEASPIPELLAGGIPPATPEHLFARLDELDIAHRTVEHPPLFTVEQAKALRGELPGGQIKNLFLRNKKGRMWLITCLEDRRIDLKPVAEKLGAGRFSFCSAERLTLYLGVIPGAVSPFGVINDHAHRVQMVLDEEVLNRDPINLHPLVNTRTTAISPQDLMKFLEATGHPPTVVDFNAT